MPCAQQHTSVFTHRWATATGFQWKSTLIYQHLCTSFTGTQASERLWFSLHIFAYTIKALLLCAMVQ